MKRIQFNDLPDEPVSHHPQIKKRVALRLGDLPHLTQFAQATFKPGQAVAAHEHDDMCEVFLVEAGQGVSWIDGQEYRLEPGVCLVVESGETHEVENTGSDDLLLTYFGLQV